MTLFQNKLLFILKIIYALVNTKVKSLRSNVSYIYKIPTVYFYIREIIYIS